MRRLLFVAVLVVGCKTSSGGDIVAVPASTTASSTTASSATPSGPTPSAKPGTGLVINDRVVDRASAATIAHVAGAKSYDNAVPKRDGSGSFALGDRIVDGTSGATLGYEAGIHLEPAMAVRTDATGATRWSAPVSGVRSVRPPDAVVGSVAVVALVSDLRAFDDATGKPLWTAAGPTDRLATDGALFFTTSCNSGKLVGRSIVARRATDGKEAWHSLIGEESDPDSIDVDARHVIVRDTSRKLTIVFDHTGKELYRIKESVQTTRLVSADLLVFTDKRVALYEDTGRVKWARAPLADTFVAGNDVIELGGDLLIGNFGRISDSGLDVVRLDAASGAVRWETKVPGLGVAHSQYLHVAYLDVSSAKVYAVSQGAAGSFFERLDLATGTRERRCDPVAGTCAPP